MLQFLTGRLFIEPLSPPTYHRPVFLFPSAVPQSNQRTHACPPAKPGRNTLPSPPVPHHPQILIQASETKKKIFIPSPHQQQHRPASPFVTSFSFCTCFRFQRVKALG